MILKFKYHGDTGKLIPYQKYTLSQNNNLTDKLIITSTATDCLDFDYSLEFICYDSKNVPKRQYVSAILSYGVNGIEFDLPHNLTQYAGFVDIQLSGHNKLDKKKIFKSVSNNSKAFDVEPSLCVLENSLSDTPNVLTEVMTELADITALKKTIVDDFAKSINGDLASLLVGYKYYNVTFWDYDTKITSASYLVGSKITAPTFSLPANTISTNEWFNRANNTVWNFATDTLSCDIDLIINYYTSGLTFSGNSVTGATGCGSSIYVPAFVNKIAITNLAGTVFSSDTSLKIYLPYTLEDTSTICLSNNIQNLFVDSNNKYMASKDGILFSKDFSTLLKCGKYNLATSLSLPASCTKIGDKACLENYTLQQVLLPDGLLSIGELSFSKCSALTSIKIPDTVAEIKANAFCDCQLLVEVTCMPMIPPTAPAGIFAKPTLTGATAVTITVMPECLTTYKTNANWSAYTFKPVGGVDFEASIATKTGVTLKGVVQPTFEGYLERDILRVNTSLTVDTLTNMDLAEFMQPVAMGDFVIITYGMLQSGVYDAKVFWFFRSLMNVNLSIEWMDEYDVKHDTHAVVQLTAATIQLKRIYSNTDPTPQKIDIKSILVFRG